MFRWALIALRQLRVILNVTVRFLALRQHAIFKAEEAQNFQNFLFVNCAALCEIQQQKSLSH